MNNTHVIWVVYSFASFPSDWMWCLCLNLHCLWLFMSGNSGQQCCVKDVSSISILKWKDLIPQKEPGSKHTPNHFRKRGMEKLHKGQHSEKDMPQGLKQRSRMEVEPKMAYSRAQLCGTVLNEVSEILQLMTTDTARRLHQLLAASSWWCGPCSLPSDGS